MTSFILHRANSINQAVLPTGFSGAEIDLRLYQGKLVLAHDPFMDGVSLDDWLLKFTGNIVILNLKETGLEESIINLISAVAPSINYFFLDLPTPCLVKASKSQIPVAIRVSEFEPVSVVSKISSNWIWLDSFSGDWSHLEEISLVSEDLYQKTCLVSPELQGRWPEFHASEFKWLRKFLRKNPSAVQAICTKDLGIWFD